MGTLERIRQTSPYLLAVFAIIFIAFFVVSDMDPNTLDRSGNMVEEIAIVNDEAISYKDFEVKARKLEEQQRDAKRYNPNAQEPNSTQIRLQLFNQLVDETLLRQEAVKAGANVTEGALLDVMLENPPQEVRQIFTDSTGNFNIALYKTYVTRPEEAYKGLSAQDKAERLRVFREYFISVQQNVETQLLVSNIQSLVATAGTIVSPLYAQECIKDDTVSANVAYVLFDVNTIKDEDVKVSEDEIKKYYEAHKEFYEQREQRQIKYATFPIVASHNDSLAADKKVKKLYENLVNAKTEGKLDSVFAERVRDNVSEVFDYTPINQLDPRFAAVLTGIPAGDFAGPIPTQDGFHFYKLSDRRTTTNEEVKASHILIKFGDDKAAAKKKIDEIYAKTKTGDFAELAKEFSQDGSASQGGDLGFFKRGQMVKEFEDAAFAAKAGDITAPIETMYGYHIIKVEEKKSEDVEEISYSDITIKPQISKLARKQTVRMANEIVNLVNEKGMSLESAMKKVLPTPTKPNETPFFTNDRNVPGFMSPYITVASFQQEVKQAFGPWEDENIGYVIAQVVAERKAGIATLADKREEITAILKHSKKLDMVKAQAEKALADLKSKGGNLTAMRADSTSGVKFAENVKNNGSVPQLGRDFAFTQKAVTLPTGQISPIIRGERGYYIMQVETRNDFTAPAFKSISRDEFTKYAKNGQSMAFNMWYAKLKELATIEDKRIEIYGTNF